MPSLDRITLYPVKSLDGVNVTSACVLPSGGLAYDRRWRLVDRDGRVVNAKRTASFHAIRAEFDLSNGLVSLSRWCDPATAVAAVFPLVPGHDGPCGWLSDALGITVLLEERPDGGFPDDRDAPGPTVVSTATLAEVARWFGFDLAESRRRFRANLEIGDCEAFWEDTLTIPPAEFSIRQARFGATNACRRCVVPSRDSRTGAVTALFRAAFETRRARGFRPDVDASGWNHFYRLAVNTAAVAHGTIHTGDAIECA